MVFARGKIIGRRAGAEVPRSVETLHRTNRPSVWNMRQ